MMVDSMACWRRHVGAVCLFIVFAPTAAGAVEIDNDAALGSDEVVARRDGLELTVAEIDAKVRSMPADLRSGYLQEPDRMARMIDSMLLTRQLAALATAAGLHESKSFHEDVELIRNEQLARRMVEHYMASTKPPEVAQLARERYLANPDAYRSPAQVDLRHVLIATDGRDEQQAEARANEVYEKARAGEDFIALVAEYSDEPSKDVRGGLIPNADGSKMDSKFAEAMSTLREVGDIAGPVRSRFGYHVIRLERHFVPPPVAFESVQEELSNDLRLQFTTAERTRYLARLSGKEVEINGDVVRKLSERYAKAAGSGAQTAAGQD